MFRFEEGRMYQMPVHFGPCCTPRQDPEGKRFCSYGPQESALHTLVLSLIHIEMCIRDSLTRCVHLTLPIVALNSTSRECFYV